MIQAGGKKAEGIRWDSEVKIKGLLKSSKRPKAGAKLFFGPDLQGEVLEIAPDATVSVRLSWDGELDQVLQKYGNVPLPPYIRRESRPGAVDRERYQTVYANRNGAIAAPTAGLHFTEALLTDIQKKGVAVASITLHVGYGTFSPVRVEDIRQHKIHAEHITVSKETVAAVNGAKSAKGRVWAVGTTTTRALEYSGDGRGGIRETQGLCDLYIYPGYSFQVVDNIVTNFHLPKSSLLFMVSAFAGRDRVMQAYREALKQGYRFYSYGDAMVLTKR
jgi:S-adenosylmethionine:tRNA ribosyltransferase-isomerase